MSNSVVDNLVGLISPQIVDSLASRLGELESAVQKGLQGGSAALLDAIACRATDSGFLERIFALIKSPANDLIPSSLENARLSPAAVGLGTKFMSQVFGSQQSNVTDIVGRASGLKPSSATSVLGMAAPLVLGMLAQRVRDENLTPSSLGGVLSAETANIKKFLPSGLGGLLRGASHLAASTLSSAPARVAPEKSGMRLIWPLLALLVLVGLLWYSMRGKQNVAVPEQNAAGQEVQVAAGADLGEFIKRPLPNGMVLNIPKAGIENKLISFIEDPARPANKTTWFDFDRLQFETGKSTLQNSSQEQLDNIANVLAAYPNVKVKIGGYTDNTGDKAMNMNLSADRAATVMNALLQAGVNKDRLSAEGYGEDHPVADNTTEEGRTQNRRTSLRVTEK